MAEADAPESVYNGITTTGGVSSPKKAKLDVEVNANSILLELYQI
jgi:hypothetical protein